MVLEISKKTLGILLIITLVFALIGTATLLSYSPSEIIVKIPIKKDVDLSKASGEVSLRVGGPAPTPPTAQATGEVSVRVRD